MSVDRGQRLPIDLDQFRGVLRVVSRLSATTTATGSPT